MSNILPDAGRGALLQRVLDNELHIEFSSTNSSLAPTATALTSPLLRKRVFNKGYASPFESLNKATFAYIADAGQTGSRQTLLASRLTTLAPANLIYAGDLTYLGGSVPQITSALAVFNSFKTAGVLWPAFGNHDEDDAGGLTNMLTYFSYLGGQHYYHRDFAYDTPHTGDIPPVHVSFYHSGQNTAGTATEPDGRDIGSVQALALKAAANASPSPWKVCVVHHPPVGGREGWIADLAHLMDGTWDLILCGHLHVAEEIDCRGACRLLNVSSVRENRGSGTLEGALDTGIVKLWSNDAINGYTMLYATQDYLAWDIRDITTNAIIRQSYLRKPGAKKIYTTSDTNKRWTMTTNVTSSVMLNVVIDPTDFAEGVVLRQIGFFMNASATVAAGQSNVPINTVTQTGIPLLLQDGQTLTHSIANSKSLTRVIRL